MTPRCRFCHASLTHTFVDLGMSPLCESYLSADQLEAPEMFYPLHALVCSDCFLVQLQTYVGGEDIFTDYAYFSAYSDSWLDHSRRYVDMAIARFRLGQTSRVIEVASNDGYLLQYFNARHVPCVGIEPAANVAVAAEERGVRTRVEFLGRETAERIRAEEGPADLVIGNNVLAQVPDLNDFVAGLAILLAPDGVMTLEFPHLLRLVAENQFDTIYHEHFSYFSFTTTCTILRKHGLSVFDVEELSTHGGSLRVYAQRDDTSSLAVSDRVADLLAREAAAGMNDLAYYDTFAGRVQETKRQLLEFLIDAKRSGKRVAGYGAPGKGNTLLNYCGIRTDFLDFTADRNPHKQGKFLPGTHIPIRPPEAIREARPDYVIILPWNLREEIVSQLAWIRDWGGRFVVPIPETAVLD